MGKLPAHPFKLGEKPNGRILKVHETLTIGDGVKQRNPVELACLSDCHRRSVMITRSQQAYVFDFDSQLFWIVALSSNSHAAPTAVCFIPGCMKSIVLGTQAGELLELNIETGKVIKCLRVSHDSVSFIRYSIQSQSFIAVTHRKMYVLTNEQTLTFLYSLDAGVFPLHNRLAKPGVVNAIYLKSANQLLVHTADSIHFWNTETQQIDSTLVPLDVRDRYLAKSETEVLDIFPNRDAINTQLSSEEFSSVCCAYTESESLSICVAFSNGLLILCNDGKRQQISAQRFIEIPRLLLIGCKVFTQPNGKRFYLVFTNTELVLINLDNLKFKVLLERVFIKDVITTEMGHKSMVILETGECLMFDLLEQCSSIDTVPATSKHEASSIQINNQIETILPRARLMSILQEFNEFPHKYRPIIWKSLLQLPQNHAGFLELAKREAHPCTDSFPQKYPLKDAKVARNLARTVSCLAHWCKVFGMTEFLPRFVFPFLKVFANDSMLCFETIATILLNHGQLWFEFAPLEPTNYLGIVENIIGHFEPKLIQFYRSKNVPSSIYALSLIESAFTEVLNESQWYALWDNIVSSQPYFMLFCVVALNIALKPTIVRLDSRQAVEQMFADPISTVDVAAIVKLARTLMRDCPEPLHPRQYFHAFQALGENQYQPFMAFPRELVDKVVGARSINAVQLEVRLVNEKLLQLEQMKRSIEQLFGDEQRRKEHGRRLEEVERAYESAVRDVERAAIYNN